VKRWLRKILLGILHPADLSIAQPASNVSPEWTEVHRAHLLQFLQSPTGQALLARGRAVHADMAIRACQDVFHTQHTAGRAYGFGDQLKWLESLSRPSRAPEDSLQEGPLAGNANTDTPPLGETELRELLSP
jgi:hypothetical protein